MKIKMNKKEFSNFHKINHCIYVDNDKAYKNCLESYNIQPGFDLNIENVSFYGPLNNITFPQNLLYDDNNLFGYQMKYLKGYFTISQYIKVCQNKKLSNMQKIKIIKELSTCLRKLNEYYSISDINNNNIMIDSNGNSSFIDWENGKIKGEIGLTLCKYDIYGLKSYAQEDSYKLYISLLSLFYDKDMEKILCNDSVSNNYEKIREMKVDNCFKKYAEDMAYESLVGNKETIYLDEYIKVLKK